MTAKARDWLAGCSCYFLRGTRLRSNSPKSNNAITGTRSRLAICSMVSNDGALIPRSIRLTKSREIPTYSMLFRSGGAVADLTGETRNPSVRTLVKIANALRIS